VNEPSDRSQPAFITVLANTHGHGPAQCPTLYIANENTHIEQHRGGLLDNSQHRELGPRLPGDLDFATVALVERRLLNDIAIYRGKVQRLILACLAQQPGQLVGDKFEPGLFRLACNRRQPEVSHLLLDDDLERENRCFRGRRRAGNCGARLEDTQVGETEQSQVEHYRPHEHTDPPIEHVPTDYYSVCISGRQLATPEPNMIWTAQLLPSTHLIDARAAYFPRLPSRLP